MPRLKSLRRGFQITLWLVAGSLWGCATYQPQSLAPDQTAAAWEARTLADPGLRGFVEKQLGHELAPWPPRWDLELLTLAAYYYHPDLDVARAQWQVAEAAAISAGARPNPVVSVAPGFTANSPVGTPPWLLSLGFDWPVETAGKRGLRITQARQLATAAQLRLVTAAWQVRANVRDSLAAFHFAGNQAGVLAQKLALQKQQVDLLERRLANGAISEFEVAPVRIAMEKIRTELAQAHETEAAAGVRLAGALGVPRRAVERSFKSTKLYTPQISAAQLADARRGALLNRADLRGALAEFDAAQTALKLEIARQYPDIHLNPNYEYDQGANKWRLGLSLELPVLNQNQGPIAEAKARRDEVAARFTALQAKVISDIDAAGQAYQRAHVRQVAMQPTLAAEVKHEQAMAAQVQAGAADALDLVGAKIERLAGVALDQEAGYRAALAFGQLEDALQQLLEQRPGVVAAPPPEHLEINPRAERTKP